MRFAFVTDRRRPLLLAAMAGLSFAVGQIAPADVKQADPKQTDTVVPKLVTGTWSDVESLVAANKGRVVVVDIWSTACLPCMEEFPGLVKLQAAHPDKVTAVSFNIDYAGIRSRPPEHYRSRVEKFLATQKADFRNYLSTEDSETVLEKLKLNSIPAVYVFGPDGVLVKRFDESLLKPDREEAFTYQDDINPLVEKLVD